MIPWTVRSKAAVAGVAACVAGAGAAFRVSSSAAAQTTAPIDRTVLPLAQPMRPIYSELDARNVHPPAPFTVKAPAGAPNVLVILLDDVGFGASGTFGGPVPTPTLDRLARNGLRYNNFHTTALSSPTRVALKTGRNHHVGNMGSVTETATGFPGNTGQVPNSVASIGEILRLNGYSTAAFGKWHETAVWETSVSGPYDRWPTLQGFDKFYGFIGGETNQWSPLLFDGVTQVPLPDDPKYHFLTDMTDKTAAWIGFQKSITPDKPFFVYYAPGATYLDMADHEVGRVIKAIEDAGQLDNTLIFYMVTWTKQVASSFGGTSNGMVVHWPRGIRAKNELRTQFSHVIDVVPTILEAATLPQPKIVNGTPQIPIEGTSLVYTFDNANAKERRAIYHDGWFAGTVHRAPWESAARRPFVAAHIE